jgi:O-antigen/teichoic acid export membrane protein
VSVVSGPAAKPPAEGGWVQARHHWLSSALVRQSALYTTTNLAISALGAVASALLARLFSTSEFGAYSFALAFLAFSALFFEFGLFMPVARLASAEPAKGQGEIAGAVFLTFVPVGLSFSLLILVLSFLVDGLFQVHVGGILRIAALLAFAYPFGLLAQWLAMGAGRLHVYSLATFGAQLLFVGLVLVNLLVSRPLSPAGAVTLQLAAMGLGWFAFALWLRPTFRNLRLRLHQLLAGAREYGLQVYIGRILSMGTYSMDVLMLGALFMPAAVGFYVLAGAIAGASGMPALAFATALFRNLANRPLIERRWLLVSVGLATASTIIAWLLAGPFVRSVFTERYAPAAVLVVPLAAAAGVRGVTSLYNSFLSAHGLGKELRNAGIALTVSNLILNFALIPPFGAAGAAWASLLALVVNLIAHLAGYRRYRRGIAT